MSYTKYAIQCFSQRTENPNSTHYLPTAPTCSRITKPLNAFNTKHANMHVTVQNYIKHETLLSTAGSVDQNKSPNNTSDPRICVNTTGLSWTHVQNYGGEKRWRGYLTSLTQQSNKAHGVMSKRFSLTRLLNCQMIYNLFSITNTLSLYQITKKNTLSKGVINYKTPSKMAYSYSFC